MFKCSEQLLFSCVSSKVSICNYVTCRMSHVTCHMLYVKCLCWSLGHAEQFLFSSLGSKVAVYRQELQCFFLWPAPPPPPTTLRSFQSNRELKILFTFPPPRCRPISSPYSRSPLPAPLLSAWYVPEGHSRSLDVLRTNRKNNVTKMQPF